MRAARHVGLLGLGADAGELEALDDGGGVGARLAADLRARLRL